MVPRTAEDISDDDEASGLHSEDDDSEPEQDGELHQEADVVRNGLEEIEEEYHTEESDEEASREDANESEVDALPPSAPLLPKELLKPLPSPAYSLQNAVNIPYEQMTRREKKAQRNRSVQAKKKVWKRLRLEAEGTGVLEAGKVAQLKRGIIAAKNRVQEGRIEKKTKAKAKVRTSGRQQLLEQRKRHVERKESELMRPPKKRRTRVKG